MNGIVNNVLRKIFRLKIPPEKAFLSDRYQLHNQKRLEHLASMGLDISGSTVLEVGAGIGDHTGFFLNRRCRVVSTDARLENLKVLRSRYPDLQVSQLDIDRPETAKIDGPFDIVYCYGLLYHLGKPAEAIKFMAGCCKKMLLLETCVSFGDDESINVCKEPVNNPTQSASGHGCRPTRRWIRNQLNRYFEFVYMPITQPDHEEFPIDWSCPAPTKDLTRSVFVASRYKLNNDLLVNDIPMQQKRLRWSCS